MPYFHIETSYGDSITFMYICSAVDCTLIWRNLHEYDASHVHSALALKAHLHLVSIVRATRITKLIVQDCRAGLMNLLDLFGCPLTCQKRSTWWP